MLKIRQSDRRGFAQHGWLKSYHSFSFSSYYDPNFMGYRALRVINEDWVEPSMGFSKHPHQDMEILTYVIEGALKHEDSMGNGAVIKPGDVQIMSAGTGVLHSEMNASHTESVHLLQIWMLPNRLQIRPRYDQKFFSKESKLNQLRLVGSHDGRQNSVQIFQDIDLYASVLETDQSVSYETRPSSGIWLQLISGRLSVNGVVLEAGDGVSSDDESRLSILAKKTSEFLLFDLGRI